MTFPPVPKPPIRKHIPKNGLSEKQVKDRTKARLKKMKPAVRYFMPVGGMHGEAGVSDIIVCVRGRLLCIETKAGTGKAKVSHHQVEFIESIKEAGGDGIITSCPDTAAAFVREFLEGS